MNRLMVAMLSACVALQCLDHVLAADDICQTALCLANGETPCDRSTGQCPPCTYAIPGGYSCYPKINGACPYVDILVMCPEATAAVATTSPPAVASITTTPKLTTAAPTPATVDISSTSSSSSSSSRGKSLSPPSSSTTDKSSSTKPTAPQDAGTVVPANTTAEATATPPKTDRQDALATDTKSSGKPSPGYVNVVIIVGAAIGVLVVAVFIVRRVRQRRDMPIQEMDFKTPHMGEPKNFAPAPHSTRRNRSRHSNNTQTLTDRIDFSMLEPGENPAVTAARTKSLRPSVAPSSESSMTSSNVPSASLEFTMGTAGRSHLPHSYSDDRLGQFPTIGRPRTKSRVRGVETSLIQNQFPELAGSYNSDVSSVVSSNQSDEFDIVDPGAIRPGERRNTETLVADGHFRQFSTASLAESFVSDATTEGSEYGTSVYI